MEYWGWILRHYCNIDYFGIKCCWTNFCMACWIKNWCKGLSIDFLNQTLDKQVLYTLCFKVFLVSYIIYVSYLNDKRKRVIRNMLDCTMYLIVIIFYAFFWIRINNEILIALVFYFIHFDYLVKNTQLLFISNHPSSLFK